MAGKTKLGAVVVVQNDGETIERSIASYYPYVDAIVVSTDPKRGWSGLPITPDDTLARVRRLDTEHKVHIVEEDFCRYEDPQQNETNQRQRSAEILTQQAPYLQWVVQVDADEEFLDFPYVARTLRRLITERSVYWRLISIFNLLEDGRLLVVVDQEGKPKLEKFPLAHRPNIPLVAPRLPPPPTGLRRKLLKWKYEWDGPAGKSVLHYSYAKSEQRIWEKLQTFGHARHFDTDKFFRVWKESKHNWAELKNFHPLTADHWPALKPFTLEELHQAMRFESSSRR